MLSETTSTDGAAWLTDETPEQVETLMRQRGWLGEADTVTGVETAGEGNMNVTLRVFTSSREAEGGDTVNGSVVLKQARPWVARYPEIAAPVERASVERRWYETVAQIAPVAELMPRLLGAGQASHTLLLEDLGRAVDLSTVYADGELEDNAIDELAEYLRCLHDATKEKVGGGYENRAMRALNHAHIFEVPMQADNGFDLDGLEAGLNDVVAELRADETYLSYLEDTGQAYLDDGDTLLHGDFFPGSWLATADGVKVIDPEFGFAGPGEWDVAVAVSHLVLAERVDLAQRFMKEYGDDGTLDTVLLASFAAAEVMRRLVGVAQLPLPEKSAGWRAGLLRTSRDVMINGELAPLLG